MVSLATICFESGDYFTQDAVRGFWKKSGRRKSGQGGPAANVLTEHYLAMHLLPGPIMPQTDLYEA